ncbi:hypothetical protein LAZ67_X002072 [Cordylochernes scorpioides]|uniref:Uncharacterized protein n=1 Tax=Cordylochernes scorpioides TaxID=51811 RepID=A0ABY6LT48_9ARAC|nr:hypothetical protein LAZ67_X002072 [Cordylochernes scorpioides]
MGHRRCWLAGQCQDSSSDLVCLFEPMERGACGTGAVDEGDDDLLGASRVREASVDVLPTRGQQEAEAGLDVNTENDREQPTGQRNVVYNGIVSEISLAPSDTNLRFILERRSRPNFGYKSLCLRTDNFKWLFQVCEHWIAYIRVRLNNRQLIIDTVAPVSTNACAGIPFTSTLMLISLKAPCVGVFVKVLTFNNSGAPHTCFTEVF